jgi:hypothetical protein
MPSNTLLKILIRDYPRLNFTKGADFMWSPKESRVYYNHLELRKNVHLLSLLHETSHGILKHNSYSSDIELVGLELLAWEKAKKLAKKYTVEIDEKYIEDCMNTYRNWLHRRSLCPHCCLSGLQTTSSTYLCIFCLQEWRVSAARFCRPYRRVSGQKK